MQDLPPPHWRVPLVGSIEETRAKNSAFSPEIFGLSVGLRTVESTGFITPSVSSAPTESERCSLNGSTHYFQNCIWDQELGLTKACFGRGFEVKRRRINEFPLCPEPGVLPG